MTSVPRQYPLPLPHRESLAAEDFMVTPSNSEAVAWIERWPAWPAPCLIVTGPAGSGKSHLIEVWRQKSQAPLGSIDALTLGEEWPLPLALDQADSVAGHAENEEKLFHLYNRARDTGQTLLLTAALPATQWGILLPDLRSRLAAAPSVALKAPDDALVGAMLIKQFRDRQLQVESGVIDYLLPRIERSPAALRQLVHDLDQASLASGKGITTALARSLLKRPEAED